MRYTARLYADAASRFLQDVFLDLRIVGVSVQDLNDTHRTIIYCHITLNNAEIQEKYDPQHTVYNNT